MIDSGQLEETWELPGNYVFGFGSSLMVLCDLGGLSVQRCPTARKESFVKSVGAVERQKKRGIDTVEGWLDSESVASGFLHSIRSAVFLP